MLVFRFFLVLVLSCLFNTPLNAQLKNNTILNIDNPSFRKLVVAIPDFEVPANDKQFTEYLDQVNSEFPALFQFTGFFTVIGKAAFAEKKELKNKTDEVQFWKMIGVDTVVRGKFLKNGKQTKLEFTGLDVYRGKPLEKKHYVVNSGNELNRAFKQYIDYLLEIYTGKPGIFQSKIVFAGREKLSSPRQIYICEPDGTNVQQITKEKVHHISPSWHPSGNKIVFTSYESGTPNIYLYDLHTKVKIPFPGLVVRRGIQNSGGKFAPQGNLMAYTQISEGTDLKPPSSDIYIVGMPGTAKNTKARPLITGVGINVDPVFSPDGKWLVYASGRYGTPQLFRAELVWNEDYTDVKVKSELRLTFAKEGALNTMPSWSPDSQKIVFTILDRDIKLFDIFMMNFDGSKLERLTLQKTDGANKSPSFSPNGQLIIFHSSRLGGRNQLHMMTQNSTEQRIIPTGLYDAEDPKWGPYMKKGD